MLPRMDGLDNGARIGHIIVEINEKRSGTSHEGITSVAVFHHGTPLCQIRLSLLNVVTSLTQHLFYHIIVSLELLVVVNNLELVIGSLNKLRLSDSALAHKSPRFSHRSTFRYSPQMKASKVAAKSKTETLPGKYLVLRLD